MTAKLGRSAAAMLLVLAVWLTFVLHLGPSQADPASDRALVRAVGGVGITVSDIARAVDFYSTVLFFERVSDVQVSGAEYGHLHGESGAWMRVVRMRLGEEVLELTEYLAPKGRPAPADARSNDRWFQHVAIIVRTSSP